MRTLLISAAEPSGDRLAAELIEALQDLGPVRARGIAGPKMREVGVEAIATMEEVCSMGLIEVLGNLGPIQRARRAMNQCIMEGGDALVMVDAPDLHLPMARIARSLHIPAIGYVSPQIWAWRPGRAKKIAADLDALLCLFEFEPPLYQAHHAEHPIDVRWVGHPLVDRFVSRESVERGLYGLLPGSRDQEIERMLVPFLDAAAHIRDQQPQARFRLVGDAERLQQFAEIPNWMEVVPRIEDIQHAEAALCKSGTVTLELALMGVPMVVAHRVHPLTYWVGRLVVRGISHIALPNILAGEEVVPEFVQGFHAEQLAQAVLTLPQSQPTNLSALGPSGASQRAAAAVQEMWS